MALAHAIKSKTEEAYRRGDLFAKRAKMMADYGHFAEAFRNKNVVQLPARRSLREQTA